MLTLIFLRGSDGCRMMVVSGGAIGWVGRGPAVWGGASSEKYKNVALHYHHGHTSRLYVLTVHYARAIYTYRVDSDKEPPIPPGWNQAHHADRLRLCNGLCVYVPRRPHVHVHDQLHPIAQPHIIHGVD